MANDSTPRVPRRRALTSLAATAGVAALPGCSALWDQTGATDVILHHAGTEPRTVSVTITANGAEGVHTDRTLELSPGDTVDPVNPSKLPTNAGYTVDVAVEGGTAERYDWEDPQLDLAPLWILIDDGQNVKFLLQAG